MRAYQLGSEQAFDALYRRHSGRVYGYLKGKLSDRALVDDVFQGTFLKLHSARGHYDPSFPFVPWLFTICRSVLTDQLRKKARTLEDLNEVAVKEAVAEEVESAASPPDLNELPVTQRKAVELRYGSEMPFDEIAKRLETTPANVRQLVSRAIRRLRRQT